MTSKNILAMGAAAALLVAGCGTNDTPDTGDSPIGEGDDTSVEQEADADETIVERDDTVDTDTGSDATGPQAHTSLLVDGDPALTTTDDEVSITLGPAGRSDVPFLIYNGTDNTISRVEVSGMLVDGDGNTLGSGNSHGVEPNVIPPDGFGFGFVYGGPDDLPAGATVDNPAIDYATGLGDFENIVTVDIDDVTVLDDGFDDFTGTLTNPHDIEVTGPISAAIACLDDTGGLTGVFSTYADRDSVEPGGTSTFTISMYGDDVPCDAYLVGGSGYTDDF